MKYGLLVFEKTDNLGDDIQAYATRRFLPRVDYYVDREHLDTFSSKDHEKTAVIMNAWYMHNKFNWPPSDDIVPLLISMHFSSKDHLGIGWEFLKGLGGEFLRQYGPVGCRDEDTLKQLRNLGIDAYFSGCMTLTLPRQKQQAQEPYICAVDVDTEVEQYLQKYAKQVSWTLKTTTHKVDYYKRRQLPSWEVRMETVEKQLQMYQNAMCVVTPRLHVALPCLAMEVPVLLLYDEKISETDRLSTFAAMMHHVDRSAFLSGKCSFNLHAPEKNPPQYLELRKNLINSCERFIQRVEGEKKLFGEPIAPEIQIQRLQWQKQLIEHGVGDMLAETNQFQEAISQLQTGKDWLEDQYNALQEDNQNLREIGEKQAAYEKELLEGKTWLEGQNRNLREDNEKLDAANQQLSKENQTLNDEIQTLNDEIQTKSAYQKELLAGKDRLEKHCAELGEKTRELERELEEKNAQLAQLQNMRVVRLQKYVATQLKKVRDSARRGRG